MADFISTASRLGVVNGAAPATPEDANKLFMKQYAGEVLTSFNAATVALDRAMIRTINSGKSAQFPVMGKTAAGYHTPGARLEVGKMKHAERVITIDDLLTSSLFIYQLDEAKNHYDVRSEYSKQQGIALANTADKQILQVALNAARTAQGTIPNTDGLGTDGGSIITPGSNGLATGADFLFNPDDIARAIKTAARIMDEKNVPEEDRVCFLRPAQYWALVESNLAINRDFNPEGNGSVRSGKVFEIAGIEIIKTNHLPNSAVDAPSAAEADLSKYAGDFTNTAGLVMHKSAVGTVKLMDLALESEYLIEYQGTLMVAKYAMGHDILRPESAVEISAAAPAP